MKCWGRVPKAGTTAVVKQRCVVKHGQGHFGVGGRYIDYHRKTLSTLTILTIMTRGRNSWESGGIRGLEWK